MRKPIWTNEAVSLVENMWRDFDPIIIRYGVINLCRERIARGDSDVGIPTVNGVIYKAFELSLISLEIKDRMAKKYKGFPNCFYDTHVFSRGKRICQCGRQEKQTPPPQQS